MTHVGFAGLGRMGAPMAANIARAGFELSVWNRNPRKAQDLAREVGAEAVATPGALVERADVVVTMLANDDASTEVHLGPNGLLASNGRSLSQHPLTILVMGTHSPGHIGHLVAAQGPHTIIDAPVSGSTDAATAANLLLMAGATTEELAPVQPVLNAMGRETIALGQRTMGAAMKLAVNMLIHGLNQTLAEALTLTEAIGIDPAAAYSVFEQSAAAAPMLAYRKPQYLDEGANPVSFALSLASKDVDLALQLARQAGVVMPQTQTNLDQLRQAEQAGFGQRDMAAMLAFLRYHNQQKDHEETHE